MIPVLRMVQEVESRGSDAVDVAERLLALAVDTVREVWWRLQGLPPEQLLMLAALGIAVLLFRSFRCLLLIVLGGSRVDSLLGATGADRNRWGCF